MDKLTKKLEALTEDFSSLYYEYDQEEYHKQVAYELGQTDGIKKGINQEKKEIAKKMLAKGKDIAEIIEFTGLTKEEIENL